MQCVINKDGVAVHQMLRRLVLLSFFSPASSLYICASLQHCGKAATEHNPGKGARTWGESGGTGEWLRGQWLCFQRWPLQQCAKWPKCHTNHAQFRRYDYMLYVDIYRHGLLPHKVTGWLVSKSHFFPGRGNEYCKCLWWNKGKTNVTLLFQQPASLRFVQTVNTTSNSLFPSTSRWPPPILCGVQSSLSTLQRRKQLEYVTSLIITSHLTVYDSPK